MGTHVYVILVSITLHTILAEFVENVQTLCEVVVFAQLFTCTYAGTFGRLISCYVVSSNMYLKLS